MLEFIMKNWDSVLVILLFILFLLFLIRRGATKQVKQILFWLVTEAEAEFGGGTGELKFAAVTAWIYARLPVIIRLLFTTKQIDNLIEEAVKKMKEYLENNENAKLLILPPLEEALD